MHKKATTLFSGPTESMQTFSLAFYKIAHTQETREKHESEFGLFATCKCKVKAVKNCIKEAQLYTVTFQPEPNSQSGTVFWDFSDIKFF